MPSPLRVVIAEDNYLVREGTRRLLEDSGEVDVIAAVGTSGELIDAVELLVAHRARAADSPVSRLSPRELEVLREMAQGKTNGAIGAALVLSESAVEKHVNAIFSKLGLSEEPHIHRRVAAVLTYLRDLPHTQTPV